MLPRRGKVATATILNITLLPFQMLECVRTLVHCRVSVHNPGFKPKEALHRTKGVHHGDVSAVLGTMRPFRLFRTTNTKDLWRQRLVLTAARPIGPKSKMATLASGGRSGHVFSDCGLPVRFQASASSESSSRENRSPE